MTTYTVSFETNGAEEISDRKVEKNGTLKRPDDPEKKGFIFTGWFTDKSLKNEYDFESKVTKNMILYAGWEDDARIILTIGKKAAMVFGEKKSNDVAPIIVNDRTMLPARFVAESLGAKVSWDEEKREVKIVSGKTEILIYIDSDKAFINGKEVTLDSPAFIRDERTYTPVRFVAEALGAKVEWNEDGQKVTITNQK